MANGVLLCVLSVTLFAAGVLAQGSCTPACSPKETCLLDPSSKQYSCVDQCQLLSCQADEVCAYDSAGTASCQKLPPPPPPPDPSSLPSSMPLPIPTPTPTPAPGPCDPGRNPCKPNQKCYLDPAQTKAVCVQVLGPCDPPNNPCKLGERCLIEPSTMQARCIKPRQPPNPCDPAVSPCMAWEQCVINPRTKAAMCSDNDPCADVVCDNSRSEFCVVEPNSAQPICLQINNGRCTKRVMGPGIDFLRGAGAGAAPPPKPAICSTCKPIEEECLVNTKKRSAVCIPASPRRVGV